MRAAVQASAAGRDAEDAVAHLVAGLRAERRSVRRRNAVRLAGVAVVVLLGFCAEVLVGGTADIRLAEVPGALVGQGSGLADFVIFETRLPRALTALLVGALFGLSGVVYQRLVSNVLATPDIIGVSAGASAGAVAVLVGAGVSGLAVQAGAVLGAVAAAGVIFGLSRRGGASTYRLVLIGIGVGACCSAITSYLLTFADSTTSTRAMRWMIGSLAGAQWNEVVVLAVVLGAATAAVRLIGPDLEALRLGDPLAAALGAHVQAVRVGALLLGATLAAIATSVAGPIAFIALVSGPIAARLLTRSGPFPAALIGAAVLVLADVAAQTAPYVSPVPTGVLTGLIGAPLLMLLLIHRKADA
ncbi:iron ABC transporter permease [Cellulomonas cellasea]|uniref:FecCD family ABC transporter permease n=1 Tax=Cellulomonas cellasea TaxID=43670 RepID=UPI0025A31EA1|nr:iron ABC transporter permease [Cellulomonas cellasea]MDM8083687.1 iron ABC transporter permease [Cellulomonas cellasea]